MSDLAGLVAALGVEGEPPRLREALTHASRSNEARRKHPVVDNERLEFLGDAVLDLAVSEALMDRFPHADEGALTRMYARVVQMESLAALGRELGLAAHLELGRGAKASGEAHRDNVLADAVEAVTAAVYLHAGLPAVRKLVARLLALHEGLEKGEADPKSALQEAVQAAEKVTPVYRTVREDGPDHERVFEVEVVAGERVLGAGRGRSKKLAERDAAASALAAYAPPAEAPPAAPGEEDPA